jgi:tripartite-type tricarboxylate transporter receptor subunit TctC
VAQQNEEPASPRSDYDRPTNRAGVMVRVATIVPSALPVAAALLAVTLPRAAVAEDFFAGRTISLSTHSTPGAGYDTYLRLLARHMGNHIPGRPSFVVINQPGAGGLLALNHAAKAAPQDGTFLTLVSQGLLVIEATGGKGLQISLGKFKWLGNFSQSNNVTVTWVTSNVKTLQDAMTREVVVGATGAGSATVVGPTLYNSLLGTRFKIIQGYSGSGQINLAMQRGELDGHANSTWTSMQTMLHDELRDHQVNVLIQTGLRKEAELPDVPLLSDLIRGDPKKEAIAQFLSLAGSIARPLAAPPGVPDDRVVILRRAFDATMKDPEFLAEAHTQRSDVDPMTGEDTQSAIARILATPKSVIADVQAALGETQN